MVEHRLLRASAGTGKTYQLTEAYAALVTEGGLRPHEIVAITFTRKAAAELKLRIRARLREAALPEMVLTELSHAPVTNFHGLALHLLRQMGSHKGAASSTRILANGDDAHLFAQACETAWLTGPAEAPQDDLQAAAVRAAVAHISRTMDVAFMLPDALWEALARAREDGRTIDAALLGSYAPEAVQAQAHARLQAIRCDLQAGIDTQTAKSREKVEAFLRASASIAMGDIKSWSLAWAAAFAHIDRRGKLGQLFTAEDKAASEQAIAAPAAESACAALVAPLGQLLDAAWQRYEGAKLASRAMDFADIIARVVAAMQQDATLHAGATSHIRAVLVDEAQDTNRLQRELILLLSGLSGPAARPDNPAQLIVVGDRKQCIYTFRGADPQSFDLFATDIAALGGEQTQLRISRRSRPHVVAGINHLGTHMFGAETYEALEALPREAEQSRGGMHWVPLLADGPDAPEEDIDAATREARAIATLVRQGIDAGARPADYAVLLATMTHAPLSAQALAAAGIPAVVGGGGGLLAQPEVQDILALLAWLCDPGARLDAAIALRSPLLGLSDGALTQLLHRAKTPAADNPLATLPSPAFTDPLMALAHGHMPALDEAGITQEDQSTLASLVTWLPLARQAAETMSVADCLQYCDAHLHIRAIARGQAQGAQKQAHVERLWDLASSFAGARDPSVQSFVRTQQDRLARGYDDPLTPASDVAQAAVRVCSVHQSKGLQFPRVILAFLNRRGRGATGCIRYDRNAGLAFSPRPLGAGAALHTARWRQCAESQAAVEDAELRRLLYVAVTRAEAHIYFVGAPSVKGALSGFGRMLLPWRPAAQAAGVLDEEPLRLTWAEVQARGAMPLPSSAQDQDIAFRSMPTNAPKGASKEATVTALASAAVGDEQPLKPKHAAAANADAEAQIQLEPRLRGHLVHRVLCAVAQLPSHPDAQSFVATQLEIAGYAPHMPVVSQLYQDLVAFLESPAARPMLAAPQEHRRHELPFVLRVPHPTYALTLRGQLDLVYWDNEGPVIVDYKHAHKGREVRASYLFQLDAYALAVAQMCQIEGPIRTQLVYLRDRQGPHHHLATDARRRQVEVALRAWADNSA